MIGGIEPARTLIMRAIAAGKSVVTANKAVIAATAKKSLQRLLPPASTC